MPTLPTMARQWLVILPEDFQAILVPSDDPVGPYGAKSVSEISVNAAAPAIASAIHDATGVWGQRLAHYTGKNA